MEIIGESAHRMLAYVEAVRRQGHGLTEAEFEAYADGWDQRFMVQAKGMSYTEAMSRGQRMMNRLIDGSGSRVWEPMLHYLCRVKWLSLQSGQVDITALGKSVLREANAPLPDSNVSSTLEVIIDPENPFAYAQLMARIGSFDECMVVDPYLDQDQLLTLATFASVTRILTSNYDSKKKAPAFGVVLASESAAHLQLRTVEPKLLHDRIVIPSEGSALMLGSSLNSIARRFGVATPLEESSSRLILAKYNAIWEDATPIAPAQLEPAYGITGATVDEGTGS